MSLRNASENRKKKLKLLCAAAWSYSPKTEDRAAESAQRAAAPGLKAARQPPSAIYRRIKSDGPPAIPVKQKPPAAGLHLKP